MNHKVEAKCMITQRTEGGKGNELLQVLIICKVVFIESFYLYVKIKG